MKGKSPSVGWRRMVAGQSVAARIACAVAAVVLLVAPGIAACAAIIGTTGNVLVIDPPESVVLSFSEDDTNARLFVEQSALSLPESIVVDVTQPSTVQSRYDLTSSELAANTLVNSYLLHADPIDGGYSVRTYQGSVTFNTPILGAMVTAQSMTDSDAILGSALTNYIPPTIYRGFEGPGFPVTARIVSDMLELSADLRTVSFLFHTTSQYDQIRIVTAAELTGDEHQNGQAAVPEPSRAWMAVVAMLVLGCWLRR